MDCARTRPHSRSPATDLTRFVEVKPFVECPGDSRDLSAALSSSDMPFARSGHRLVANQSWLMSIGGYNPDLTDVQQSADSFYPLLKELWKFNLLRKTWTRVRTTGIMPSELASHAAVLNGDFLLVSGGTGVPFGHTSSSDLHLLDMRSLQWTKLSCSGDVPEKQYGHGIVVDGSKLYVIGGTTGFQYNMDVHMLDLSQTQLTWTDLSRRPEPEPRYRHEIVFHEGKLYVFGGGTSTEVFGFDKLDVFDVAARKWERIDTRPCHQLGFPEPRRCHTLVALQGSIYMVGGYNGSQIFNDLWKYDLSTRLWKKFRHAQLSVAVFFHGAAVTPEGCLYVFGGVLDKENKHRTNKLSRVWLTAPPLKRLAAEKLFDAHHNLVDLSAEQLLTMGVPKDIVSLLRD